MLLRTLFLMPLAVVLVVAFSQHRGATLDRPNRSPHAGRPVQRSAQPPAAPGSDPDPAGRGVRCPGPARDDDAAPLDPAAAQCHRPPGQAPWNCIQRVRD